MSKRPWTYEQHAAAHAYFRNISQEKAKQIKKLEAENKAILRRAEAAEEDWQRVEERITQLEALRDTVLISCNPPADCNDPKILKTYMKTCFDEAEKLYD